MTADLPAVDRALRLELAAERYFLEPSRFLSVFAETPEQAIAALRHDPTVFGPVRSYVGPISTDRNHAEVVRTAKAVLAAK